MALLFGKKREDGKEVPSLFGTLKVRLPFVHYGIEFPELFQGMVFAVIAISITTIFTEYFGIPFAIGITMSILNTIMYQLHPLFGDSLVVGWLTPCIPLTLAFVAGFPMGPERIQAMIAVQLCVALIFFIAGITKSSGRLIKMVPNCLKAGILLGAGIAALYGEFKTGGRVSQVPIGIMTGTAFSIFMLFSKTTESLRRKYSFYRYIAQFGIAVPTVVAYGISVLFKELPLPQIEWYVTDLKISAMFNMLSPFKIGFPSIDVFISAIPLAIAAYVIAFGDILVGSELLKVANEKRPDEKIGVDVNRNSLIVALRNAIQGLWYPFYPMSGPQWTAGQALVISRYVKTERKQYETYWGGNISLQWGIAIGMMVGAIVTFFKPAMPIGFSLTMMIQGYLCTYLGMEMLDDNLERGIAAIIAVTLAAKGALWGLGLGIIAYLLIVHEWGTKKLKA